MTQNNKNFCVNTSGLLTNRYHNDITDRHFMEKNPQKGRIVTSFEKRLKELRANIDIDPSADT